jgi:hypothetical protein
VGVAFLFAPVNNDIAPLSWHDSPPATASTPSAREHADSLTEDIILYNLFTPSRSAPSRRFAAGGTDQAPDAINESTEATSGFSPVLIGTAVSERPGETKALLQLLASDPTPRLYGVGDRAGGFTVVSIDARSVVLNSPRGRVVLRLPENEESHS